MESAVKKVEALIQKADSDLDFISSKLEAEVNLSNQNPEGDKINRMRLIEAIQDIKKEYSEIVKEVDGIKTKQQEVMNIISEEIKSVCNNLQTLQDNSGLDETS